MNFSRQIPNALTELLCNCLRHVVTCFAMIRLLCKDMEMQAIVYEFSAGRGCHVQSTIESAAGSLCPPGCVQGRAQHVHQR